MWLVRRLVASVAIIFAVVTFVFILILVAPGKACTGEPGETADPVECARRAREFALDRPLPEQYRRYLVALAHGDFGYSFSLHRPVRDALAETIPFTLQLAGVAVAARLRREARVVPRRWSERSDFLSGSRFGVLRV